MSSARQTGRHPLPGLVSITKYQETLPDLLYSKCV